MKLDIEALGKEADELADAKCQSPGEFHPDWHDERDKALARLIVERCAVECDKRGAKFHAESPFSAEYHGLAVSIRQLLEDK